MSGWSCPHQFEQRCLRLRAPCYPGVRGCVLYGKVRFIDQAKPAKSTSARFKATKPKLVKPKAVKPKPTRQ